MVKRKFKTFKNDDYRNQLNPAYKKACFRRFSNELIELKGKYDYFIQQTNK